MFDYEDIDRSRNETDNDDYDWMVAILIMKVSHDSHHVQRETSSSWSSWVQNPSFLCCFEPVPETMESNRRVSSLNGTGEEKTIVNLAIADEYDDSEQGENIPACETAWTGPSGKLWEPPRDLQSWGPPNPWSNWSSYGQRWNLSLTSLTAGV